MNESTPSVPICLSFFFIILDVVNVYILSVYFTLVDFENFDYKILQVEKHLNFFHEDTLLDEIDNLALKTPDCLASSVKVVYMYLQMIDSIN